jgi:ribosome biogenesis GTPase A
MAKARREVTEALKLVDVVIEIVDARLPVSSRNPMMAEVTQNKPIVIVLGKADMADDTLTAQFRDKWKNTLHVPVVAVDNLHGQGMNYLIEAAKQATAEKFAKMAKKGIRRKTIRAMVVGIPNVGKSTMINRLAKRSAAKTGDKPGVTKQQQWIKVGQELELLDTPGILWPKFDDRDVALRLAWSGAIKSTLLESQELALELLTWLKGIYPQALQDRYQFSSLTLTSLEMLQEIASRRVAKKAQDEVDIERAAELLLRDVQTGLVGRITFDDISMLDSLGDRR